MSRKISLFGPDAASALSVLAHLDIAELLLVAPGASATADDVAEAAGRAGARRRVFGSEDLADAAGSAVVVLAGALSDGELAALARHAPDAILVVAAGDTAAECERVLAVTAMPRPRVVGVASAAGLSEGTVELAAAIVLDRRHVVRCVAGCRGEAGLEGTHVVRARVGAGGVAEIAGAA
jgi:malate/lactate dehydrogenase